MELYLKATMKDGELIIKNHDQVRHLLSPYNGKEVIIGIDSYERKRSDAQNRWYWGVAISTIRAIHKERTGEHLTPDEIHAYNISKIVKPELKTKEVMGSTIIEVADFSTRKMSVKQFNSFKDQLQLFWAEKDIDIPDPGENEGFVNELKNDAYDSIRFEDFSSED